MLDYFFGVVHAHQEAFDFAVLVFLALQTKWQLVVEVKYHELYKSIKRLVLLFDLLYLLQSQV